MDQLELLVQIQADTASIRAHNIDIQRRITNLEESRERHDSRIRRAEIALLPVYTGIGYIVLKIAELIH